MDAVEIYKPNIEKNRLEEKYRKVWCCDIADFEYKCNYDLILFGDILEHLPVEKAQQVVEVAKTKAKEIIISVPFLYPQDAWGGNQWEYHYQEDLTPENFDERYPGFRIIHRPRGNYAYYALARKNSWQHT